jgi:hypothetical protein
MLVGSKVVAALMTAAFLAVAVRGLVAQSALAQLGLTETQARNFVLEEIKSPSLDRRSEIAIAGTRAFLQLPRAARGAAATGLFAWARAYTSSSAFSASYASYRKGRIPQTAQYSLTVEEAVKKDLDEQLAGIAQLREAAASMPPADRDRILESAKKAEATLTDPVMIKQLRDMLAAERQRDSGNETKLIAEVEESVPADPGKLFEGRLREFLDETADVDFAARTLSLNGGPDGIVFLDRADRKRHWLWQQAVIVGPEATAAARAAAEAWLKELEK